MDDVGLQVWTSCERVCFQNFKIFFVTAGKRRKSAKKKEKQNKTNRVYQHFIAALKGQLTPKHWLNPGENIIFLNFGVEGFGRLVWSGNLPRKSGL